MPLFRTSGGPIVKSQLSRHRHVQVAVLTLSLSMTMTVACERAPSPIAPSTPSQLAAYVTDEVVSAMNQDGSLVIPGLQSVDGVPLITEARARQLAAAYLRTYGRHHLDAWQSQRGATISLAALNVAPRVYLARSPYGPVPIGLHPSAQKLHGPYYIVPLLENGQPAVLLAVSAYNTDMKIESDGQLTVPRLDGNSFPGSGVPTSISPYAALTPEDAITRAARASGRRVARVPELVLPGAKTMPIFALWRVTFDSTVVLTRPSRQGTEHGRDVFVGRLAADDMHLPAHGQPADGGGTTAAVNQKGHVGADVTYRVPVLPGHFTEFERVTVKQERP